MIRPPIVIPMARRRRTIYVESRIRAPIERLWEATQEPAVHQRWDVRFGRIDYQPRQEGEPQRFTYATKIFPGVTIAGTGESLGERDRPDGTQWSGLKFWADDRRSIIESGAGYWRYIPTDDGVRFLTGYDYKSRWGWFGKAVDRWLFRPTFGWATAWSFDRLRIWLEQGIPPEVSRNLALAHTAAIAGVASVWFYHGLVPKVLLVDQGELDFWLRMGVGDDLATAAVVASGFLEIAFAILVVLFRNQRWPFLLTIAGMIGLLGAAAWTDPELLGRAFNPVGVNLAMIALALVALATLKGRPSGRRPLRVPPDDQPEPVGDW